MRGGGKTTKTLPVTSAVNSEKFVIIIVSAVVVFTGFMLLPFLLLLLLLLPFLDGSTHLYMRVCPSVRRSVGPSVHPLVGP